jgi:hypothetical protein
MKDFLVIKMALHRQNKSHVELTQYKYNIKNHIPDDNTGRNNEGLLEPTSSPKHGDQEVTQSVKPNFFERLQSTPMENVITKFLKSLGITMILGVLAYVGVTTIDSKIEIRALNKDIEYMRESQDVLQNGYKEVNDKIITLEFALNENINRLKIAEGKLENLENIDDYQMGKAEIVTEIKLICKDIENINKEMMYLREQVKN